MNGFGRLTLAVMLLGSLASSASVAADLRLGTNRVSTTARTGKKLTVTLVVASQDKSTGWAARMWGADEDHGATLHVDSLGITSGGLSVDVPLSAYSDLGNPRSVEFVPSPRRICFVVRGGETSTDYTAKFFIEGSVLTRRRVSLGELPEFWEEARYSGPARTN